MGILTKKEIKSAIRDNALVANAQETRIQGCSYDMTVGTIFKEGQIINAAHPDSTKQVIVPPGGIVTILTEEELQLPSDIAATAFAINSMSSKGFLVLNPGHVDPGFKGPLTVTALNLRKTSFAIQRGEPVFTVIFQRLPEATAPFVRNKPREDREREINAQGVELTPNTLSEMIELDHDGPYPVRSEVQEMIRTHYMSRWSAIGAIVAAVASVVAIVLQLIDLRGSRAPERTNQSERVHLDALPTDSAVPASAEPVDNGSTSDALAGREKLPPAPNSAEGSTQGEPDSGDESWRLYSRGSQSLARLPHSSQGERRPGVPNASHVTSLGLTVASPRQPRGAAILHGILESQFRRPSP